MKAKPERAFREKSGSAMQKTTELEVRDEASGAPPGGVLLEYKHLSCRFLSLLGSLCEERLGKSTLADGTPLAF